ncbi:c-type cytochrome [Paracraurococcus ruber]|uniref:Cytochrome c domain-containing protein n=1 Tax=Paracraurococcus ruber TaxID=77675 RepID=A0ABS1CWR8_9PROT|nr:c-type cytochrome [Paracraurococcus ruber]MBK1658854.1 hypothetical protein [Paracraurococcus ruber]TDG32734.1 c-type cytochrome [Paracraurococcus ruber]
MRRARVLAAAVLAAAAFVPMAWAAGDAARGAAVAEARSCGGCHGAQGVSAQPGIPSLAAQQAEFVTLQMILFREGIRDAAPMNQLSQGLSDQQVEDLAAYYASLPPGVPGDRAAPREALAQEGARLSERLRCGICHRADYHGQNQVPRIAGQREEFLAHALQGYRDGTRRGTDTNMNAVMYGVTDAEIGALAHYLAQRQ